MDCHINDKGMVTTDMQKVLSEMQEFKYDEKTKVEKYILE